MASDDGPSRPTVRARTLSHLQHLVAAATVVGVGVAGGACKKETVAVKNDDAAGKDDVALGVADGSLEPAPTVPPVADPNATAESTLDSSTFADSGGARARVDAGPKPPFTGYAVVDPLPRPTRIPKTVKGCDPPYTIDSQGVKHYKPECLK